MFHLRGNITYRCFAGFSGKPKVSPNCDNKDHKKILLDKDVSIKIVDENDPEDSKTLEGGMEENFEYMGQKFVVAISLFKDPGPEPYRIRLLADRAGLRSEQHVVFAEVKNPKNLNKLSLEYFSNGDKDTTLLSVIVGPLAEKK